eukprot:CAMPEP_0181516842 /NCGR_PEP_ID=MMETSP1110-20121109/64376_1 /TAXON_ID=174948 /ORGANISM="Symbiodinium sp., Strain CCMP421" /LENGTH=122 /DNA_ID=CAMNT_0023647059 /DNA_START=1 /DNA_END=365 /DNA_ORIENTATION=+
MTLEKGFDHFDQEQHVREAMRYLDDKEVKKVLRELTESVLLRQPADPKLHMLEELWESTGRSWSPPSPTSPSPMSLTSPTSGEACTFLGQRFSCAQAAVRDLLPRVARLGQTFGARASFYSA